METVKDDTKYFTQVDLLFEFASLLNNQNDFDEMLRLVTQKAIDFLEADVALIMMLNPITHQTIKTVIKEEKNKELKQLHFVHTNISGWVIKNQEIFISDDVKSDNRFKKELFEELFPISALCIPIKAGGNIIGTLLLLRKTINNNFDIQDSLFAEKFIQIVSPHLNKAQKIQEYFNSPVPDNELIKKYSDFGLYGKSRKFIELLRAIESVAKCNVRVLLEGETGTGKELAAKAIHFSSDRSNQKFVVIDCGAVPANLIESELFGHIKGAYTGAIKDRKGFIEEANGGSIFIDEICNLPLELQSKLLRLVQENEFRPLGSNEIKKVDVRIIAASSVPLIKMVKEKKFREELFYRLNVYPIQIPSLNNRRDDIHLLAQLFIKKFTTQQNKKSEIFDQEIMEFINNRNWPGNVREFENFVERMVTLTDENSKVIDSKFLPVEFRKEWNKIKNIPVVSDSNFSLNERLSDYEEQLIRQALVTNNWNQSKAAQSLKIPEQTLRYKMEKLKIINPNT